MPTEVTINTTPMWAIGAMLAAFVLATWAIKKVIKLANRS